MVLLSVVYTDFSLTGEYQKFKKDRERVYILEARRRGEGKGGEMKGGIRGGGPLSSLHNTFPLLQSVGTMRTGSIWTKVSERGGVFNKRSIIVGQGIKNENA